MKRCLGYHLGRASLAPKPWSFNSIFGGIRVFYEEIKLVAGFLTVLSRGCDAVSGEFEGNLRKAVFFDRDGVLNVDHGYVARVDDFEWMPGAQDAIRAVRTAGYLAVIITNQSGIGRGYYTEDDFLALTEWMLGQIEVEGIYYCPHSPEENCPARKPGTRMIENAVRDLGIELQGSWLIGDKDSDMEAAERMGIHALRFSKSDLMQFVQENILNSAETS